MKKESGATSKRGTVCPYTFSLAGFSLVAARLNKSFDVVSLMGDHNPFISLFGGVITNLRNRRRLDSI